MGEFIAALAVYAHQGGAADSDEEILNLFRNYMYSIGRERLFYMHTDTYALGNLKKRGTETIPDFNVHHVPIEHQEEALSIVTEFDSTFEISPFKN